MARKLIVVALLFVAIVGLNAAEAPESSPVPAPQASEAPEAYTIADAPDAESPDAESPAEGPASSDDDWVDTDSPSEAPEVAPTPPKTTKPADVAHSDATITVKISSAVVAAAVAGFFSL